jgi:4-hydroxy-3-polyprenylbenzoate decarboxylase
MGNAQLVMPGIIALQAPAFANADTAAQEMRILDNSLGQSTGELAGVAMIVVCDDAGFTAQNLRNFLWVSFTRTNPSHDMYGVQSFTENKHWGCRGPLILDARIKPHHAPAVEKDPAVEQKTDRLFAKGGSLYGIAS